MKKILYIKANPKTEEQSRTFKISEAFVKYYKEKNPNHKIITLDLYKENIRPLTLDDIETIFGPKSDDSKVNPLLKYAYEFAEADKYIVASPFWNLSVPSILKVYVDYICVTGISFKYTESGSLGLLENRRAVHITTRGGYYSEPPLLHVEMGDKYLRGIFGFMGITDFTTIAAEGLDIMGNDIQKIVDEAIEDAKTLAQSF